MIHNLVNLVFIQIDKFSRRVKKFDKKDKGRSKKKIYIMYVKNLNCLNLKFQNNCSYLCKVHFCIFMISIKLSKIKDDNIISMVS